MTEYGLPITKTGGLRDKGEIKMENPKKVRVLEPFIGMAVFIVAVIYIINAFNTGNWVWFLGNTVNVTPSRIIIVDHGNRTVLNPGHPDFDSLVAAAEQSLSH